MKSIKNRVLEHNALTIGISYILLTAATMITSYSSLFPWYSPWQICVIIGYAFGDVAIVRMFLHVQKNHRQRQLIEEEILRELKKDIHKKLESKLDANGGLEK